MAKIIETSGEKYPVGRRDRYELVAKIFAWLIVVGLGIELWQILPDSKFWPDAAEKLSGTFLILVGVAGEIMFGAASGKAAEALRHLSELKVAEANERASSADEKAALATENAAKATKEQEKLRAENLALEKVLAPRMLKQAPEGQRLAPYSTLSAVVWVIPEWEARRTAKQIEFMLSRIAGWKGVEIRSVEEAMDGIEIHWTRTDTPNEHALDNAAQTLVSILKGSEIRAEAFGLPQLPHGGAVPANTLLIIVGAKPTTHFVRHLVPDWAKAGFDKWEAKGKREESNFE